MCPYSKLKKKICVNGAPYVPKLYTSNGIDIS